MNGSCLIISVVVVVAAVDRGGGINSAVAVVAVVGKEDVGGHGGALYLGAAIDLSIRKCDPSKF